MSSGERRSPAGNFPRSAWPAPTEVDAETLREEVVHQLGIHFAKDDLSMEELERRLGLAFRTTSPVGLRALVSDLPYLGSDAEPVWASAPGTETAGVPPRGVIIAAMGGAERKGGWLVPRHLKLIAVMGGIEIDLRHARFGPGVTEIDVIAIMGGVGIIVPPGVRVETLGVAIMGGFGADTAEESVTGPDQPVVRLSGLAFMAGVGAEVKRPRSKALRKFQRALRAARKRAEEDSD